MTFNTRQLLFSISLLLLSHVAFTQASGTNSCNSTFQYRYNAYGYGSGIRSMVELNDGSLLATVTTTFNPPLVPLNAVQLTRFNKQGAVLSAKQVWYNDRGGIISAIKHLDGGVFTVSSASQNSTYSTAFSRYDAQLNLQWEKTYQVTQSFDCTVDTTGNAYVGALVGQFNLFANLVITRLNADGQVGWRYQYKHNDIYAAWGSPGRLCYFNNKLYVTMQLSKLLHLYTLLLCINPADGSVEWSHMMTIDGLDNDLTAVEQLFPYRGRLCMVNSIYRTGRNGGFQGATLVEMDAGGNATDVLRISTNPKQPLYLRFLPDKDGNLALSGDAYDYNVSPATYARMFLRIDPSFKIINSQQWQPPSITYQLDKLVSSDGFIYEYGMHDLNGTEAYLRKSDASGKTGNCPYDTLVVKEETATVSYTDLPFTKMVDPIAPITLTRLEAPLVVNPTGADCPACDTVFINGPSVFCDTSLHIFKAGKTLGCTNPTRWELSDQSVAQLSNKTDSSVQVKFIKNGTTTLRAVLTGGCGVLADSMSLTAHMVAGLPALGKDTSLCNTPLLLHAQPGYEHYLWQDGSMDSVFSVQQPGQYYVATTDFCGQVFTDTVRLTAGLAPPVQLGVDTSLCSGDSLVLHAGNQFTFYHWNTGGNAESIAVKEVGAYSVAAQASNGCISRDTLVVKNVYPLPVGFLPGDTSLCGAATLQLIASSAFASYTWSSGQHSPTLLVTQPGSYGLLVKDSHGCNGYDSVRIVEKDCGENGIWFPDSFTPNNDHINDSYGPVVRGKVSSYQFRVYNRYGQLLFSTDNYRLHWNGTRAGKSLDIGAYPWTCSWQFDGQPVQFRKGNVLLLR